MNVFDLFDDVANFTRVSCFKVYVDRGSCNRYVVTSLLAATAASSLSHSNVINTPGLGVVYSLKTHIMAMCYASENKIKTNLNKRIKKKDDHLIDSIYGICELLCNYNTISTFIKSMLAGLI